MQPNEVPYLDKCPVCGEPFTTARQEFNHALKHTQRERKTDNINFRIQPSRHRKLAAVAREHNLNTTEAIDHAIRETWNV